MRRSILMALTTCCLALGCSVSPQPEPVRTPLVGLDLTRITLSVDGAELRVVGVMGAVTPGSGEIVVVDHDTPGPAAQGAVAEDGSFDVRVDGAAGDVLRLVAHMQVGWSEPVDVTRGTRETLRVDFRSGACATRIPGATVEFGGLYGWAGPLGELQLKNECASAARISSLTLRAGDTGFTVDTSALPLSVPAGETVTTDVRFGPPSAGLFTDVLYVGIEGVPEPIPVSLLGSGPGPTP